MHYIRQIIEGDVKDWVHILFTRYGRGSYLGPSLDLEAKKKIKFKASIEYINAFIQAAAQKEGVLKLDGAVYAKKDFRNELKELGIEYDDDSKEKKGLYIAKIKGEYPSDLVADLIERIPYTNALLNVAGAGVKIKTKKKPPKPGKEKDVEFTSGTLDLECLDFLKTEILFDAEDFEKITLRNTYEITELEIPEGMGAAQARLDAKRVGELVRSVCVDSSEAVETRAKLRV